jgi:lysophospholipase L1-like esterase
VGAAVRWAGVQPDREPRRTGRQETATAQPWWLSGGAAALVIAILVALGAGAAAWTLAGGTASAAGVEPTATPRPVRATKAAPRSAGSPKRAPASRATSPAAEPTSTATSRVERTRDATRTPKPAPTTSPAALTPVPEQPRIMMLGDSITYGIGSASRTGYRTGLGARLAEVGVEYDFVGSQHSGRGEGDLDHEGHPGWRIDEIAENIDGWMAAIRPDVVLLDIGTNDYVQAYRTGRAPQRLAGLIDAILQASPTVRVVVAKLLVCGGADRAAGITELNAAIPGIAAAAGPRVSVADMSDIATTHTVDGLHPDDTGYRMMARRWFTALKPVLGLHS